MIWFSADQHFNHKNVIKYCDRPFDNVEQMNNVLVNNWNEVVKGNDTVYVLGDFAWRNPKPFIERLKGNKIFVAGGHDKKLKAPYMKIIHPLGLKDEYGNDRTIVLCHWAMRTWHKSHYASWHLFGHSHGNLESYGLSFDVGVDCNNYYPFSLQDIAEKMKTLFPIVDFRKQKEK